MNKFFIFSLMFLVVGIGFVSASCSFCNQTCSPCGGGCTATDLTGMFSTFTDWSNVGNISGWDTSCITSMNNLFSYSTFNQDISSWSVVSLTDASGMFDGVTLPISRYDALLSSWSSQSVKNGVHFSGGNSRYSTVGGAGRTLLQIGYGWNISDGGLAPVPTVSFVPFTEADGSSYARHNIVFHLNASSSDAGLNNVTFFLFNSGHSVVFTDSCGGGMSCLLSDNITGIPDGTYFFNATVWDLNGLSASTETRTVTIGASFPCLPNKCTETCSPCGGGCNITNMSMMFYQVNDWSNIGDISGWDTSCVNDMSRMFQQSNFNQPIGGWDVSNVVSMRLMFYTYATPVFNQPLGSWNTHNVKDMSYMFGGSYNGWNVFNQDISGWDTSSVTKMDRMFSYSNFNQPLNSWDVSHVTSMTEMFWDSRYNQPLNNWDVSSVTDMTAMFSFSSFNQPIGGWNVASLNTTHLMFWGASYNQSLNWGSNNIKDMSNMFYQNGVFNNDISGLDVSHVTNMAFMFYGSAFNQPLNSWNTHNVKDMSYMFGSSVNDHVAFNQPLNNWDTSSVTNMDAMFFDNYVFNQDISSWDTSSVTSMVSMFGVSSWLYGVSSFNQNLSAWNTSKVTSMAGMFAGGGAEWYHSVFNGDVSGWDTSNVISMNSMFSSTNFNQNISRWNTSKVTDMASMFDNTPFNYDISRWDVSKVTNMAGMFARSTFNQNISRWNTSKVTNMASMFAGSTQNQDPTSMNSDISGWDTSSVTDMNNMFYLSSFNQPINSWNVSKVTNMVSMFEQSVFTQPLNNWDTHSVTNMASMFERGYYNYNLGSWNTGKVTNMNSMFFGNYVGVNQLNVSYWNIANVTDMSNIFDCGGNWYCSVYGDGLSAENYDKLLNAWSLLPVKSNVHFGVTSWYKYSPNGYVAHNHLATVHGWVFSDGGINMCSQLLSPCSGGCPINNLNSMFAGYNFTSDPSGVGNISGWNTSCITSMSGTFAGSTFNQDINSWDVSHVTTMSSMFAGSSFNQPLNSWNTGKVQDMSQLFGVSGGNIGYWDGGDLVSDYIYGGDTAFNQDISGWNISSVTSMRGMFMGNSHFNKSLNSWDIRNVSDIALMFMYSNYSLPLNSWNTSSVTTMEQMFAYSPFNQNISGWDTRNVNSVRRMFYYAGSFDQNLGSWNVSAITGVRANGMFDGSNLSVENYDAILNGWSSQSVNSGVSFSANNVQYSSYGLVGRNVLTNTKGWSISDSGLFGGCYESWVSNNSVCNGVNYTVLFYDSHSCNTTVHLPVSNGSVVSCGVPLNCSPSWSVSYVPSTCTLGYRVKSYYDLNNCNNVSSIPVDNGSSVSCSIFSSINTSSQVFLFDNYSIVVGAPVGTPNVSVALWYPNSSVSIFNTSWDGSRFVTPNIFAYPNGSYSMVAYSGNQSITNSFVVNDYEVVIPTSFDSVVSAGMNYSFSLEVYTGLSSSLNHSVSCVVPDGFTCIAPSFLDVVSYGNASITILTNSSLAEGLYTGYLNVTRLIDGKVYASILPLGIAVSFGVPHVVNPSSVMQILYSNDVFSKSYNVSNIGDYVLSNCSVVVDGSFSGLSFVSGSSNFSLLPNESRIVTVTYSHPPASVYTGYFNVKCVASASGLVNGLDNPQFNQLFVFQYSAPVNPPNNGGGGGAPPTVIVLGNNSVQSFLLLNKDGSANGYVSYSYPLDVFSKTFVAVSKTADNSNLQVSCRGDFCQYVTFSKTSLGLSGFGTDFFTAQVKVPQGVDLNGVYSYEVVLSEGLKSTSLVNQVHISTLSAWYSKFYLVVEKGDSGFWFSVGNTNVPKLLLYLLIVLLVDGATMLLLPKGKFFSQNIVLILTFVSLITFGLSALIF